MTEVTGQMQVLPKVNTGDLDHETEALRLLAITRNKSLFSKRELSTLCAVTDNCL